MQHGPVLPPPLLTRATSATGDYDHTDPTSHLILEVAGSSLSYDREHRAQLHAQWTVDLVQRVVEVHRQPAVGRYEVVAVHRKGERTRLFTSPDVELTIDDLLG